MLFLFVVGLVCGVVVCGCCVLLLWCCVGGVVVGVVLLTFE